jgi:hypothetical protein
MDPNAMTQGQVWVAVISLLGSIVAAGVTLYTQHRNRQWTLEDAARLEAKTAAGLAEVKKTTAQSHDVIVKKLDHNTELTGMAYNAANNWQERLERLAKVFDSVHTDRELQKQIQELASETNSVVHEMQPEVAQIKELVQQKTGDDR